MTVKTTIELPEHQLRYAEKLVEDGHYPSIDSVLAASMAGMMDGRPPMKDEMNDPVSGMADELRRRMELPKDQWLPWDGEAMIERIMTKRRV